MSTPDIPPTRAILSVVAGTVGVVLLVVGLVALARTGVPAEALTDTTASVGPFTRTPLMAIIEIVIGLVVVVSSVTGEKGSLMGVGVLAIVFGLVWLIEPGAFAEMLGVGRESALLYLVLGVCTLVAGSLIRPGVTVREVERIEP